MYGMPQTAFGPSFINRTWVFEWHNSVWGMMRGVGGVRKPEHQIWSAKCFGLGLLSWGFKGVQEEIPTEEGSTHQISAVTFPPGQCSSLQIHPCHRLFDQSWHQDSFLTLPIVQTLLPVTFAYSQSSEALWDNWGD